MKFDPLSWNEVKPNGKEISAQKGQLWVRCSAPCPLYITVEGVEALAGVSCEHTIQLSDPVKWRVDAPQGVRVFFHRPHSTSVKFEGEVYTNIDQMPQESGSILEVKKTLRLFHLEQQQVMRGIREARDQLAAERDALEARRQGDAADDQGDDETVVEGADDEEAAE